VAAPIGSIDSAVQVVVVIAALAGGGTLLGLKLGPGVGAAIALGGLSLLALCAVVSAERELEAIRAGAPKVEFGDPWAKREMIFGREWVDFVGVNLINTGSAPARNLWVLLQFHDPGDEQPFVTFTGRWSQNPIPVPGESFEAPKFTRVDLPPNSQPEPFDVAARFEPVQEIYGFNSRSWATNGRHPEYEIDPGRLSFVVRVTVRGDGGVQVECSWRCDRDRDRFELRPTATT
jgi:hypothetical protein